MLITYLGHAGFCVETSQSVIIMDPWLSKQGAFDAAWYQYPKNHHMSDFVQAILSTSKKDKYIYISHEHKDHFDINFLQSLMARDFTLLLANFTYPLVKRQLDAINYSCKNRVLLNNNETYLLKDGLLVLFVVDTELNCDSAILVKSNSAQVCSATSTNYSSSPHPPEIRRELVRSESQSFLNINDCKINDQLERIVLTHGPIDVFTGQFSGASWYPTCYVMSDDDYQKACQKKILSKFEATAEAIEKVKPKIYLPSAGPPCFLDPMLAHIHKQEINSYPQASQLIAYLDQHCEAIKGTTKWVEIVPGDEMNVATVSFTRKLPLVPRHKEVNAYLTAYAKDYEKIFADRREDNKKINPQEVFVRLKQALQEKLNELQLVNHTVHTLLYWRLNECPETMYCLDLANKTIEITTSIHDLNKYCRLTAPAWLVNKVLIGDMNWPDFALTFRMTIERVPDVYNTILHGFLILDAEKIRSFCEKMANASRNKERITIECEGKQYSILRYCPHQGADLSQAHFDGCYLVCPRHQWHFDMENKGKCLQNESTLEAIYIPCK